MTDTVFVAFGDNRSDTATLLLAAAEELGYEPGVVTVDHFSGSGGFRALEDVAEAAGLDPTDADEEFNKALEEARKHADDPDALNANPAADEKFADPGPGETPAEKPAAKKTTTKKAAAKKTAAKKS